MTTILRCAISLDGYIARDSADPIDWTSSEDKRLFAEATKKAGVIIYGSKTFVASFKKRPLPHRLNVVYTSQPESCQSLPKKLEFTNLEPDRLILSLKKRGFGKIYVIGGGQINTLFLGCGVLDELELTICPKLFGKGVPLFQKIPAGLKLLLAEHRKLAGGEIFLRYIIKYS